MVELFSSKENQGVVSKRRRKKSWAVRPTAVDLQEGRTPTCRLPGPSHLPSPSASAPDRQPPMRSTCGCGEGSMAPHLHTSYNVLRKICLWRPSWVSHPPCSSLLLKQLRLLLGTVLAALKVWAFFVTSPFQTCHHEHQRFWSQVRSSLGLCPALFL